MILNAFSGYRGAVSLAPWNCGFLARLAYRHWQPRSFVPKAELADAIFTLAHELGHMHGISGERAADRYAARVMSTLAQRLGADPDYARALAAFYLASA